MENSTMETEYVPVLADNGVQFFYDDSIELIGSMAYDSFINEHRSKEMRYTDNEVCEHFDISIGELKRIKQSYAPDFDFYKKHYQENW